MTMKKGDRVRPLSRDEGFQKLRSLRCFNEVYERILAGWSMSELARYIQEDRQEYAHATKQALMQTLQRFRDSIPPAQLVSKRMPPVFHKATEEVEAGIDELKELENLYKLQMDRIGIDLATEKGIKKLMPTMTQEVRVARELLSAIADLKMDLGLNTRHIGQVDVEAHLHADLQAKYGKDSVKKVMADPEARRKVLNIAERILALPARTEKATPAPDMAPFEEKEVLAAMESEVEPEAEADDAEIE
jgi:hypothetical protein